jgi:hypothetical protein
MFAFIMLKPIFFFSPFIYLGKKNADERNKNTELLF